MNPPRMSRFSAAKSSTRLLSVYASFRAFLITGTTTKEPCDESGCYPQNWAGAGRPEPGYFAGAGAAVF